MDDERPEGIYVQRNTDHLRSFEEVSLGNPGQRQKRLFQLRTGADSLLKYSSRTIGHREQHLIRKANGMLYIFKSVDKILSYRRTEFDIKENSSSKKTSSDCTVEIQFDAEITEGLLFEAFSTPGEYICSLLVPLLNNRLIQLFFTADGLKLDSKGNPHFSEISVLHPFLDDSKAMQRKEIPGLLAVEPLGYIEAAKDHRMYASAFVKLAATHGDNHVCIYEVPLSNSPDNRCMQVKGGAIYCGNKPDKGVWQSFKQKMLQSGSAMVNEKSTDEIIEDLKFIGNNLICLVVMTKQMISEVRIVNLLTQRVLCSKQMTTPSYEYFYQVVIFNRDRRDTIRSIKYQRIRYCVFLSDTFNKAEMQKVTLIPSAVGERTRHCSGMEDKTGVTFK